MKPRNMFLNISKGCTACFSRSSVQDFIIVVFKEVHKHTLKQPLGDKATSSTAIAMYLPENEQQTHLIKQCWPPSILCGSCPRGSSLKDSGRLRAGNVIRTRFVPIHPPSYCSTQTRGIAIADDDERLTLEPLDYRKSPGGEGKHRHNYRQWYP